MTAQNYKEQDFEEHIEDHLLKSGYFQQNRDNYNKDLCIIQDEVLQFVKSTQLKEYKKLQLQYGTDTDNKLCKRLEKEISNHGTLHVLRKGFKDRGAKFLMAFFKPSSGMNPEHQKLYAQNRFSVVRQLKYSKRND